MTVASQPPVETSLRWQLSSVGAVAERQTGRRFDDIRQPPIKSGKYTPDSTY